MINKSKGLDSFSSERYKEEHAYVNQNDSDLIRINKIIENVGTNQIVLDIGCYEGTIGEKIQSNGNKVFGIDITLNALPFALKKGIKCVCGDLIHSLPFVSNSIDVVVAGEVIEHIVDTDFFLNEIKRVLKPGGRVIITTPNAASLGRRIMLLMGYSPHFEASLTYPGKPAGHVRYYTHDLLGEFLKYHDFQIEKFNSNIVNFTSTGTISSRLLARYFPGLGACLIFVAKNN